ncbi:hypothetical protein RirG_169430 [Rhizophagus irregularis DAOM 197198w]|uniref:Uncharacterized protein n=1 Tax=Rhizophagus irregularis (strain DAOM 197198w) TaxID=1432141 RepID=A0A015M493_RHIIW|nr:hypothetical protein RirG_169430 [Rhizophagus irregularis DAOM 197198w]
MAATTSISMASTTSTTSTSTISMAATTSISMASTTSTTPTTSISMGSEHVNYKSYRFTIYIFTLERDSSKAENVAENVAKSPGKIPVMLLLIWDFDFSCISRS